MPTNIKRQSDKKKIDKEHKQEINERGNICVPLSLSISAIIKHEK